MKVRILLILPLFLALVSSCKKNDVNAANPVPYVVVNRTLNIDNPLYSRLNTPGGAVYLDDEGNKGILVVRDYADQFYAMDRTCPYHVTSSCGRVIVDNGGVNILCGSYGSDNKFVPCCDSKWSLDGNVLNGPTTFPLRRYNVQVNGNLVSITN